ncbi:uncharacterized protein LOC106659188 [Trichogramma pretiosum]|uniref:uncharacterized protein LOC106659188 n=1 Tax=Trichogramma pretiosum TaxID=7493 RepID=UPI0006C9AD5B|nr:uncharacterized protein LOC106659188 [Trichogramma pretiosum]
MMTPQVVGVLRKQPGAKNTPHNPNAGRMPVVDPQETKIRGELYVEDLGERRFVSIRMGWLWVEGTPMRMPLRALNLRQADQSICQPHALALGFNLSNAQGQIVATFWADTEPIWWSWVRAIAAELVRQTPFRAQRCLNFLEILTTCPRTPTLESLTGQRRRSRSELRCWPTNDLNCDKVDEHRNSIVIEDARRRAHSALRSWSSSNSSDDDNNSGGGGVSNKKMLQVRAWGCSESSEGSDDSLPYGTGLCRSSVDCVDSAITLEATTKEQRMQRYKEARRRENEARTKRVLEEDARRRKAKQAELNNNDIQHRTSKWSRILEDLSPIRSKKDQSIMNVINLTKVNKPYELSTTRLTPVKPHEVRFEEHVPEDNRNNNSNYRLNLLNSQNRLRDKDETSSTEISPTTTTTLKKPGILRSNDTCERRSRARERRAVVRDKATLMSVFAANIQVETLEQRKERLARFPETATEERKTIMTSSLTFMRNPPQEDEVARLLERCQRVDHYVPVREKLTLFESLSRMGGRLARSTEDLGRSSSNPSPRGKQRARSLHDLNRGRSVPVREMCRFFEKAQPEANNQIISNSPTNSPTKVVSPTPLPRTRFISDVPMDLARNKGFNLYDEFSRELHVLHNGKSPTTCSASPKNPDAPCLRMSSRRRHFVK